MWRRRCSSGAALNIMKHLDGNGGDVMKRHGMLSVSAWHNQAGGGGGRRRHMAATGIRLAAASWRRQAYQRHHQWKDRAAISINGVMTAA